jgi:hypothetical protein
MSITGYVIGLILKFIFTKLNPNNHFDFLKRFSFLKLNVYYIHCAYMSLVGLLFIMIPLISTSYEIILNFHANLVFLAKH